MASATLIALSAAVEPWTAALASMVVLLLAIDAFVRRARRRDPDLHAPISLRTELPLVGIIVTVAVALRVVGWDRGLTPVFSPSERSMLFVGKMLEKGMLLPTWAALLWNTQVSWTHDSPAVLPVMALLQHLV